MEDGRHTAIGYGSIRDVASAAEDRCNKELDYHLLLRSFSSFIFFCWCISIAIEPVLRFIFSL